MTRQFDLATQEWIEIPDEPVDVGKLKENILKLWADALEDEDIPKATKIRVARDAAPYLFAKLQAIAQVNEQDLAERLMTAIQASQRVAQRPLAETQVIEAPKADAGLPTDEAPDHSMITAPVSRGGFSKRRF